MSQRRRAQFGLLSACAVLACTTTIVYRGGRNPRLQQTTPTNVVHKTSPAITAAPVHALIPGK